MKLQEILEMEAGPELNKLVGKTLDLKPYIDWRVMNPEHTAYSMVFDFYSEAKEWWDINKDRYMVNDPQGVYFKYELVEWETWPRVSEDIKETWKVVDKLPVLGLVMDLRQYDNRYLVSIAHNDKGMLRSYVVGGYDFKTAPESITKNSLIAILRERGELEE